MFANILPGEGIIVSGARPGVNLDSLTQRQFDAYNNMTSAQRGAFSRRIGAATRAGRSRSALRRIR